MKNWGHAVKLQGSEENKIVSKIPILIMIILTVG